MKISRQALEDFKAIYKEDLGVDLSDDIATTKATNLLLLFKHIYRPLKKEDYENT